MKARIHKISKYAPSLFQGKFDFSVPSGSRAAHGGISLTLEHPAERAVFKTLTTGLAVLACCYIYFVGLTIVNVIARKEALSQMSSLGSAVASLERDYFAASQGVGPEDGERLGLKPVSSTDYVRRPGNLSASNPEATAVAILRSDEI